MLCNVGGSIAIPVKGKEIDASLGFKAMARRQKDSVGTREIQGALSDRVWNAGLRMISIPEGTLGVGPIHSVCLTASQSGVLKSHWTVD